MSIYDNWTEEALRRQIAVTEKKVIAGDALPRAEIAELEAMKKALFQKLKEPKKAERSDLEVAVEAGAKRLRTAAALTRLGVREL